MGLSNWRIFYRLRQFWDALRAVPEEQDLREIAGILTSQQMALFCRMQKSEQAHCIQVYKKLRTQSESSAGDLPVDLLAAALLHDVGKCRYALCIWERIWIVVAQSLFPGRAAQLGREGNLGRMTPWWQRPLVVAAQHAEWGAELAADAGTSSLAARLIRRHQNLSRAEAVTFEDRLLSMLQAVDGKS